MGHQRSALVRAVLLVLAIADVSCSVYSLCGDTDVGIPSNSLVVIAAGCTKQTSLVLGQQLPPSPQGAAQHSGIVANISIVTVNSKVLPTVSAAKGTWSVTNVSYLARDCSAGEVASVLVAPLVDMVASNTIANITITLVNVDLRLDATSVVSLRPSLSASSIIVVVENSSIRANVTSSAFAVSSDSIYNVGFIVGYSKIEVICRAPDASAFQADALRVLDGYVANVRAATITFQVVCTRSQSSLSPYATSCGRLRYNQTEGAILDARVRNDVASLRNVSCTCIAAHLFALLDVPTDIESSFQQFVFRATGGYAEDNDVVLHGLRVEFTQCVARIESSAYPTMVLVYTIGGGTTDAVIRIFDTECTSSAMGPLSATQSSRSVSFVSVAHYAPLIDALIILESVTVTHWIRSGLPPAAFDAKLPSAMISASSDIVQVRQCNNVTVYVTRCRLTADVRNGTMPGYPIEGGLRAALAVIGVALVRVSGQPTTLAQSLSLIVAESSVVARIGSTMNSIAALGALATHATLLSLESHCDMCNVSLQSCSLHCTFDGINAPQAVAQFLLHPSAVQSQPGFQACYDYFATNPQLALFLGPVRDAPLIRRYVLGSVNHTRVYIELRDVQLTLVSSSFAMRDNVASGASVVLPATTNMHGAISVHSVALHRSGATSTEMSMFFCFRGCDHVNMSVAFQNISGCWNAFLKVASLAVRLSTSDFRIESCTMRSAQSATPNAAATGVVATVANSIGGSLHASIWLDGCTIVFSDNALVGVDMFASAMEGVIQWSGSTTLILGCNVLFHYLNTMPLPAVGLQSFLDTVPEHLVVYDRQLYSTKHGCFLPWSRTVSHSLMEQQPPGESSAYIPPYAASASLSTFLNVAAAMDALPLVAMGQSQCGSAAMGSSSSSSQFLLSPLFPFGVAAAAAGNVAILVVVVSLHYAVVVLKSKSEPHAKSAAANGRSLSLRHRFTYVFAPCHFPNLSIVVSAYVFQGTAFFGTRALSQGSAGSVFAGLTVIAAFCCVAYLWRRFERSGAPSFFTYHSYRQAHSTSRLGRCARWCLPHGYWGNAAMRGSVGRLRNFVRCSKATAGNESTISVLLTVVVPCCGQALMGIDAPSSSTWWCPVQWLLLMGLSLATSVGLFFIRPARVPLAGVFMGVLYALQASLFAASFVAVPSIGNPKSAADVLVVLSMLYTVVAILKTMLALATFRWEAVHRDKRVDVKVPPVKASGQVAARGQGTDGRVRRRSSSVLPATDTGSALLQVPMPPRQLDGGDDVRNAARDRLQNLTALIELIAMNVHVREM